MNNSMSLHVRRKNRNRNALKSKSRGKLRLTVFRSSKHIYGQIIDDNKSDVNWYPEGNPNPSKIIKIHPGAL